MAPVGDSSRLRTLAIERGGLVGLAIVASYLALAPAHVVDGDNGEFATLGAIGGVAHPPGYPLYVLWLRVTSWLPLGSGAHRAAIATAVLGAAAAWVLHAACRAWGARPLAAGCAVAIFAGAPIVMRMHSEAEVFALNSLVVATVLLFAAAAGPLRGERRVAALALVAGLGLSNHFTCALAAPIGILGIVRGVREARRPVVAVAAAAGAFALGLVPYLQLVAAPAALSWGPIDGLGGLVHHALRLDYGGPGAFAARGEHVGFAANLDELATTLGRVWWWLPACAGVIALVAFAIRPKGESRWAWAMLAASFALAGPLLASRFDVPLTPAGRFVDDRFFIMPALLLAIPIAGVLERAIARIPAVGERLDAVLPVVVFAAAALASLSYVERGHTPAVEQVARNLLRDLPRDAVVIVADNDGIAYAQRVLGERADVTVIMWPMVPVPTYRERLRRDLGLDIPDGGDAMLSVHVAEQILARGQPLFVDGVEANILREFPTVPYGLVFHVLARGSTPPPIADVFALNKTLYEHFELGYPAPGPGDDYAAEIHQRYARTWWIIGTALRRAGHEQDAGFALDLAQQLEPH